MHRVRHVVAVEREDRLPVGPQIAPHVRENGLEPEAVVQHVDADDRIDRSGQLGNELLGRAAVDPLGRPEIAPPEVLERYNGFMSGLMPVRRAEAEQAALRIR